MCDAWIKANGVGPKVISFHQGTDLELQTDHALQHSGMSTFSGCPQFEIDVESWHP